METLEEDTGMNGQVANVVMMLATIPAAITKRETLYLGSSSNPIVIMTQESSSHAKDQL